MSGEENWGLAPNSSLKQRMGLEFHGLVEETSGKCGLQAQEAG
jgi:hypothetical protein